MKQWCVPIVWTEYAKVYVEADTLQEAIEIAVGPDTRLPEGEYLVESCEPAYDIDEIRECWNEGQKDD